MTTAPGLGNDRELLWGGLRGTFDVKRRVAEHQSAARACFGALGQAYTYFDADIVEPFKLHQRRWLVDTRTTASVDTPLSDHLWCVVPGEAVSVWSVTHAELPPTSSMVGGPGVDRVHRAILGPSTQLDNNLADIQSWLGIGLQQTTDAVGISRGTVYAWRDRESTPRPATVHAVLRIHGLVASAVAAVGQEAARAWFHHGDPAPLEQIVEARGDNKKIQQVSKQLRRELTAPPPPAVNSALAANFVDSAE